MSIKSLDELINLSNRADPNVYSCEFYLNIAGRECFVHEASVTHGDILLFTDLCAATFVVDYYDGEGRAELFDWDFDDEVNQCDQNL